MPTPFMHLYFAEQIMADLSESGRAGGHCSLLNEASWPAFYFGSVAPDYQSICGVSRRLTHFYGLPPAPDNEAYPRMLAQYPQLAQASCLPAEQALFVAAYAVHLMLDLIWFREILVPQFYNAPHLGDMKQRHLLHLILLTYLDKLALETLPDSAGATLSEALAAFFHGQAIARLARFSGSPTATWRHISDNSNLCWTLADDCRGVCC